MRLYLPIEIPDGLLRAFRDGVTGRTAGSDGDPILQAEKAINAVLPDDGLRVTLDELMQFTLGGMEPWDPSPFSFVGAKVASQSSPPRHGEVIDAPPGRAAAADGFVWVAWLPREGDQFDYVAHIEHVGDLAARDA